MNVQTYLAIRYFVDRLFAAHESTWWFWQMMAGTAVSRRTGDSGRRVS